MVAVRIPFTEREYLALEAVAETRHELIGGEILAMAGADPAHNIICHNLHRELGNALNDRPCVVVGADQRMKIEASREYFYPDLVITCLEPKYSAPKPQSLVNPQIIIEVLSPSTERYDRGDKWFAYQQIPTLTDYVMVASDRRQVDHLQRGPDETWTQRKLTENGTLALTNGVRIALASLYRMVPEPE